MRLDLNADLGEGMGADAELLQLVTSASIACGGHAGSEETIRLTLRGAHAHGVRVGAHPGFVDPAHFGRQRLNLPPHELHDQISGQLRLFARIAAEERVPVAYVKLHGALANMAAEDVDLASRAFSTVREVLGPVAILAMDGTAQVTATERLALPLIREAYADRAYGDDGLLVPRSVPGAVLHDSDVVVARALRLARGGGIETITGRIIPSLATSLCVHGDTPDAVAMVRALRRALYETSPAPGA